MKLVLCLSMMCVTAGLQAEDYDPLRLAPDADVRVSDFTVNVLRSIRVYSAG